MGLLDPSPDQIHDGFALGRFLSIHGLGCQVRRFFGGRRGEVARELASAGERLVFLGAGQKNLQHALGVCRLLGLKRCVVLFGRELCDPLLHRQVSEQQVHGIIVGEPYATALALARQVLARSRGEGNDQAVAGLYRPGQPRFIPREPLRDINLIPPGDYGHHPDQAALAIPLHTSRSLPSITTFFAERAWEAPLRVQRPDRIAEDMAQYHRDFGTRFFIFTDAVANVCSEALLKVAGGLLARQVQVFWQARIRPGPDLDRAGLQLMRQAGCRRLDVDLLTGSQKLHDRMETGCLVDAATRLVQDCRQEGIEPWVTLICGFPCEQKGDRLATMVWLAHAARYLEGVAGLGPCVIKEGAVLRRDRTLVFPADGSGSGWHDGGENNESQRSTWVREMRTWIDVLGLPCESHDGAAFSQKIGAGLRRRLVSGVGAALAVDPHWREEHLWLAGIMHGREAFCGPRTLHLDLVGMDRSLATQVLSEAAAIGTRRVVLGASLPPPGQDVIGYPELEVVLTVGRNLGLHMTLVTSLHDAGEEALQLAAAAVQVLQLETTITEDWDRVEQHLPTVIESRSRACLAAPEIVLWSSVGPGGPQPASLVRRAARLGVDRMTIALEPGTDSVEDEAWRRDSARELARLLDVEAFETVRPGVLPGSGRSGSAPQPDFALFAHERSAKEGFSLQQEASGTWICTCPAGVAAESIRTHPRHPTARHAQFPGSACRPCRLLAGCCTSRLDFKVRLGFLRLERPSEILSDLADEDSYLTRTRELVEGQPCLAGWELARVAPKGDLYICPECGTEPVGNVIASSLAAVWYSRALNEHRRMSMGSSLALPFVDRKACILRCRNAGRWGKILRDIQSLDSVQREALESVGAGDRKGILPR